MRSSLNLRASLGALTALGRAPTQGGGGAQTRRALVNNTWVSNSDGNLATINLPHRGSKSDGVKNSFNIWGEELAPFDLKNPSPAFIGFHTDATNEYANPSDVTLHAVIEYPIGGTHYDCGTVVVQAGAIIKEAPVPAPVSIKKGERYKVRFYGTVPTGGFYHSAISFITSTGRHWLGEEGANLTDKSNDAAAFTTANIYVPGGFVGVMADIASTEKTHVVTGDSFLAATSYDGFTKAVQGDISYIKMAVSGASISYDLSRLSTYRLPFIQAAGFNVLHGEYAINDLSAGNRTAAQLRTAYEAAITLWKAAGIQDVYLFTCNPHVTISGGGVTSDTNQTVVAALADGRKEAWNDYLRNGQVAGMSGFWDWSAPIVNPLNINWWLAGASADGLHANNAANIGSPAKSAQTIMGEYMRTHSPIALPA